jgi:hypothetical protein
VKIVVARGTLPILVLLSCGGSTIDTSDADADATADVSPDAGVLDATDADAPFAEAGGDANGCAAKPSGLVAWWRGEGNLDDEMGAVPLSGAIVAYSPGEVGQAIDMGDAGALHGVASPALDGLTAITIEGWFYVRGVNRVILTRRYNTGFQFEFPQITAGTTSLQLSVGPSVIGVSSGNFPNETLAHAAVTYDAQLVAGAMKFYINGASAGTAEGSDAGTIPDDLPNIYVGSIHDGLNEPFDGLLDEVSIYNRVLSASEIAAIYAAGPHGKCK